ncbi:Gastrula zinc finger protein XlCGF57.1 [Cyphomyrmex costatus]|uniref:Gastrula zinc finger protein XlCGF57.1 n=1 Tax=Cyphomyrmex costatus TaxID=456900 RepID=A0A195CSH2_9HYME|nr:Gastrula zinc finger protein XlCGF57.1 [Cyphomyrmex costatus]
MDCFMNFIGPEERVPSQSQKALYYCPKCLHGFTLKSNRNRHFRYECGHEPRFKFFLYGSYGIGLYDSTKPDANQTIRVSPIRRRGSNRRNHVCPKCGNGYTVIKSLRRHLRYECGLTPRFKCPYCGTRSKQRGHVSQHIRVVWTTIEPGPPRKSRHASYLKDEDLTLKCPQCGRGYKVKPSLSKHLKYECGGRRNFSCDLCGRSFTQNVKVKSDFLKPLISSMAAIDISANSSVQFNTGLSMSPASVPVDLSIDQVRYRTVAPVVSEMQNCNWMSQTHKTYKCPNCERLLSHRYTLKRHLITVCGKNRNTTGKYECKRCNKRYECKGSLSRHRKFECRVTPQFWCIVCKKRFTQRSSLNRHLKTKHSEEVINNTVLDEFKVVQQQNNFRKSNNISKLGRMKSKL